MARRNSNGEPSDERRAVVILERMETELHAVMKGQMGLVRELREYRASNDKRLDGLDEYLHGGFEKIWQDFEQMDRRFAGVDKRFVEVNARLDTLTSRFDTHEQAHRY